MFRDAGSIPAASNLSTSDDGRQVATNAEVVTGDAETGPTSKDDKRPEKTMRGQTTGQTGDKAPSAPVADPCPELHMVIDAWPTLPEPIRAGVLAMIRAASGKP